MGAGEQIISRSVSAREFWERSKFVPILDVRSPGEYQHGHIPDAINVPLFSDQQRAAVGITYKKSGRQPAVQKGLELVGPQLAGLVKKAISIARNGDVLVHCWRGGMRSQSFAAILELACLRTTVLNGGYKAYRAMSRCSFERPFKFLVISGFTGAGKTDVLRLLDQAGEQVIDLEGFANHRGSAFGGVGQLQQPTTEQFENLLFEKIDRLDLTKTVWVEDEGNRIGGVVVPPAIYDRIRHSPAVSIDRTLERRVNNLLIDYGDLPGEQLIVSIEKIRKRLGGLATQQAVASVDSADVKSAIEIVLAYYDKTYQSAMNDMPRETTVPLAADNLTEAELVESLRQISQQIYGETADC